MKFGQKPRQIWHPTKELEYKYASLNIKLSRLMILEHVWTQLVGDKANYWILAGVKGPIVYVRVKVAVAKNELIGRREQLVCEMNKHFDQPWISRIELQ